MKNDITINGFITITEKDKFGNILNVEKIQNNIMDDGRIEILSYLRGLTNNFYPISRLVLGTDGVDSNGNPKSFVTTKTQTFSEENSKEFYYLDWTTDPANGLATVVAEEGNPSTNSTVTMSQDNATLSTTFTFTIPYDNANGSGTRPYSEAALYSKDNEGTSGFSKIFSLKTYPVRTKDNTVEFNIEWTIQIS